jgi:hypothetical protein
LRSYARLGGQAAPLYGRGRHGLAVHSADICYDRQLLRQQMGEGLFDELQDGCDVGA